MHPTAPSNLPQKQNAQRLSKSSHQSHPDQGQRNPSINATALYLRDYSLVVESILKKSLSRMDPEYVTNARPVSIGETPNRQQDIYDFVPKIIEEIKNKLVIHPTYVKKTDIDCLLQLTYDMKNQIFKAVIGFRFGEITQVTVFGSQESFKAFDILKAGDEYQSETIYYRKVTEAMNDVIEKYRSRSNDPLKLFKCVIAFLGQFLKTQQMPCRLCGNYIKDGDIPTCFTNLAFGSVAVAHESCASRESYI